MEVTSQKTSNSLQEQKDGTNEFRKKISITFWFLFAMNFFRVFDNGIVPALTTTLKEENGFDDVQVGSLGSLVYVGEVAGSLMAMPVFAKIPIKIVLLGCLALQSVALIGFALSNGSYEVMAASRALTGMFQVIISIYAPIWADCHGPLDKKTTWITILTVGMPGGMVTGYLVTAVFISSGTLWELSLIHI